MTVPCGFGRFVGLYEDDAPQLLQRMSRDELGVDGERYGVVTRTFARPAVSVADLAVAVCRKLLQQRYSNQASIGALVLSSRIEDSQEVAKEVVEQLGIGCRSYGIERACSGFPAATELGLEICRELCEPVLIVTAEIISRSINWEAPDGNLADHHRARGQASKLFGDGAAATVISPEPTTGEHEILDAWIDEVTDKEQLIQKASIVDSVDPWGNRRKEVTGCISMPGRRGLYLVRRAPKIMADALERSRQRTMARFGDAESITHVVPHQANGLILDRLETQLSETTRKMAKVWNFIAESGNTVSASIPLAMAKVQDELPPGALVGMPAVGAGGPGYRPDVLSTGCVLVRIGKSTDAKVD